MVVTKIKILAKLIKNFYWVLGFLCYNIKRNINYSLFVYKTHMVNSGVNSSIGADTVIGFPENIFLGNNSYINGGYISATKQTRIIIGDNCMISNNVHIRTYSHNHQSTIIPMKVQGEFEKDIIIGNDVWIGFGVQIMPGVEISDGAIIGAGAVVTKNVEPYSVMVGVPARKIKSRK